MALSGNLFTKPASDTLTFPAPKPAPKPVALAAPTPAVKTSPSALSNFSNELPSFSYTPPVQSPPRPPATPSFPSPPPFIPRWPSVPSIPRAPTPSAPPTNVPKPSSPPQSATSQPPDMSQVANLMALLVPGSQSQSVFIQGPQYQQPLPAEADHPFQGKDPGISNTGRGNPLDMLRQGFWS